MPEDLTLDSVLGHHQEIHSKVPLILHAVLEEYVLCWDAAHGVAHWARVLENRLRLAGETGR
jgi:hypothetical protein